MITGTEYYDLHNKGYKTVPKEVQEVLTGDRETLGVNTTYEHIKPGFEKANQMLGVWNQRMYDKFGTIQRALLHVKKSDAVNSQDNKQRSVARMITLVAATKTQGLASVASSCYNNNK